MNDLLVLSSFEMLRLEQGKLDRSEATLNEKIRMRGMLLKREEVANQRHLNRMLVRVEMLRCEYTCLDALVNRDPERAVMYEQQYQTALNNSKKAAHERKEYNTFVEEETRRLNTVLQEKGHSLTSFALFMNDVEKEAAILSNYAKIICIRSAMDTCATRHYQTLQLLENSAAEEREKHLRMTAEISQICTELKEKIECLRKELCLIDSQEQVTKWISWTRSVSKIACARARWDFMHPICMLDMVVLEGLRLRMEE